MTTDPAENAFPIFSADGRYNPLEGGLTKREYFAALAMQGLLASDARFQNYLDLADSAISAADLLIEALNGGRGGDGAA